MNPLLSSFPTLSLNQFDSDGNWHEFYVNSFSDHVAKHHAHVLVPHRHDFYLLVYFTSGSGIHEIDFRRYSIEPGAVFFMQPGQVHHWEFSDDTEGIVVLHSAEFFSQHIRGVALERLPVFQSRLSDPKLNISDKYQNDITILLEKIFAEFVGAEIFKYLHSANLLCEFYIHLSRFFVKQYPETINQNTLYITKFRELERLFDLNFSEQKGVEFYASQLNISSRHLNRICREVAGKTFTQLLTDRVMLEARHLLSSTEMSFNEIALQLGYEEYSYFSKLFKQYCGMNARDFKNQYL